MNKILSIISKGEIRIVKSRTLFPKKDMDSPFAFLNNKDDKIFIGVK